jgi:predicted nucleotidyltransferase
MRSSIQVSERLRRRLAKRKAHERQPYEEIILQALDASEAPPPLLGAPLRVSPAVADALARFKAAMGRLYGGRIVRVVLYGSVARGDARPDSDVDVLLVLAGDVDRAREIARVVEVTYEILLDSGVHVSAVPMAEAEFLTRASPLLMNVRREGVPI